MTTLWKLTDAQGLTRNATQWGPGVTHRASGTGPLCGPGWIHAYTSPRLAMLLNPIHANIKNPLLWRSEGIVGKTEHDLKIGCTELTTIVVVDPPVYSLEQTIAFGIWCTATRCCDPGWCRWGDGWLSGSDRSESSARAVGSVGATGSRLGWPWSAREAESAAWVAWAAERAALAPIDLDAIALRALEWVDPLVAQEP